MDGPGEPLHTQHSRGDPRGRPVRGRPARVAARSRPLALPMSFASKVSVCHGEALADEARRFQFIDKGDSVIFDGDAALPFFVGHKLVSSR